MTITVFVGDVTEYLASKATSTDPLATLITDDNYKNLKNGSYYVSIGDLSHLTYFANVLGQADTIVYAPPDKWSDQNRHGSKMKEWTERYLQNFYIVKDIKGFSPTSKINPQLALVLVDQRRTSTKQLWIAGCSVSHGIGVDPRERYVQLVANALDLPVSFLTYPASSVQWAADQILRSDIRPGDILVWGLTGSTRVTYFDGTKVKHIVPSKYTKEPELDKIVSIDTLTSDNTIYHNITTILQVINFCQKLNVKLVIANLIDDDLPLYFTNTDCFIMLHGLHGVDISDQLLDLGSDNSHPGPLTHQYYAEEILKKL